MGERKLFFDDVKVGDEAPVTTHKLTRTDLVRYAGASGDFNPMHHDEVLSSKIVVTAKREDGGKKLVDLAVTLSNAGGEDKVVGEATAELPART